MRGGGWLRLAAAALLPLALVNNALVNNAATCPRHHLLGMGDELREKGYIGLWHALHGMHVWINWLDHAPGELGCHLGSVCGEATPTAPAAR